ncbi:MAG: phosphoenolpyruvate carboxykinase [Candidatus Cloacimonetes bacterium 4572_65]|nr:MAG: phosphoenolpyruvate carboxykinase [Candidatus Cloacimonetes bacterium 4572_65]
MATKPSSKYYSDLKQMSTTRAMAETVINNSRVRKVTISEAYEMAKRQPGVSETDFLIYEEFSKKVGLPRGAKILNDCHGRIIGRTAKARVFYHREAELDRIKIAGDIREAMFEIQKHNLIKGEAVVGLDDDLMIKATYVTTESDAMNMFNWLANFTPFEVVEEQYKNSKELEIQDIIIIAYNEWTSEDPRYQNVGAAQLALVDEKENVIFNLGMKYFGERKKGTLTLAWTSGMRLGMAACHGGIKEIDFSTCNEEAYHKLGVRSIAFYGLSGTGKSSHTNSIDNGGTLPKGHKKVVLHDDAFQIDVEEKVCRVWEPSLFDKTDSRKPDHQDWHYCLSLMNHSILNIDGVRTPVGLDLRNANGRSLFDRDLLGNWVNRCSFPKALAWLMKDTILPPVIRFTNKHLAVSMGTALMTKRNRAENVPESELTKLVFEPFANPFRVYELWKDVKAFIKVVDTGADIYCFNSIGYWKSSDTDLEAIPLQTSLTLQSGILMDQIEWEDWDLLNGGQIPTRESIEKILPGYYDKYDPSTRTNVHKYKMFVSDRFRQRIDFIKNSDVASKPELLKFLVKSLKVNL